MMDVKKTYLAFLMYIHKTHDYLIILNNHFMSMWKKYYNS